MTLRANRSLHPPALPSLSPGGSSRKPLSSSSRSRALHSGLLAFLWASASLVDGATVHAATWQAIESLPDRQPETVLVESTPRNYFRVTREQPLVVSITGPARLRVVSRVEMVTHVQAPAAYQLRVATARKLLEQQSAQAPLSTEAELRNAARGVGESRQMIVAIPRGKQELTISVEGASAVLLRLLTAAPASARESWVALTPVEASRSVTFKENELILPYYSILPEAPVVYRIVGPTKLDILTRLDFDLTMRGTASYRLAISDGGKPLREAQYSTTKALTAYYPDLADRVPGKFRRLRLALSSGLHEISIALVQPKPGSVEVRARIPSPAVGNTE